MKLFACDMCGKIVDPIELFDVDIRPSKKQADISLRCLTEQNYECEYKKLDLCNDCFSKLMNFIKTEGENEK